MAPFQRSQDCRWRVVLCFVLRILGNTGATQIRYSVPEEMEKGSFVGDVAKDLGLESWELEERGVRIVSRGKKQHFALNIRSGSLVTADRIDREELCAQSAQCKLNFNVLVEDKVKLFAVEVEITDVNDNVPKFQVGQVEVKISEAAAPGMRFPLPEAFDPDVGMNSLQSYELSSNHHFSLLVQSRADGAKYPELMLEQALDREEKPAHHLILTASDGGDPVHSGTVQVRVIVLDVNDNAPVFTQSLYSVSIPENVPRGTLMLTVNATDPDEGVNGEVAYSFRRQNEKKLQIFHVNAKTGEITTTGDLDYEKSNFYEIEIQAEDGDGFLARAKVLVTVLDLNDNSPEVTITSLFSPVTENSPPGTIIALLNIHDRDSGENGFVTGSVPKNLPFKLEKSIDSYHRLVTKRVLDREKVSAYNITVTAVDQGTPPLSTDTWIFLQVADTNDNPPIFGQASYSAYIEENNIRGASIYSVSAYDPDSEENSHVTYSIEEDIFHEAPLSSYISINSENGIIYALRSFDYEQFRDLQLRVTARDSGNPSLSSNVSLTLFILDQNDNAPEILYPALPTDGSTGVELAPRSAEPGYLVTKVVAVDGDSGQNAWLFYHLLKVTEPGLFSVGLHTGEIRTARAFMDKDSLKQTLVVVVSDKGEPPLSTTISVTVVLADSIPEILSDLNQETSSDLEDSSLTLYLVIAVASISSLFFAFIIVVLALRIWKWRNSQLLGSGSDHLGGVPASQFMGIDGVQAFLQTYSHEVSLTTDSRKSHLIFPQPNYADTLLSQHSCEKTQPLLVPEESRGSIHDPTLAPVSFLSSSILLLFLHYVIGLALI